MKIMLIILVVCLTNPIFLTHASDLPKGIIESQARPAPALTLSDMDGQTQSLNDYRGKWVFVHFWASWCGPCRKEMPHIQKLVNLMSTQDLAFMIINTAETEDTIFTFLSAIAPDLRSLLDHDGLKTEEWQPRGLPATYLVDPTGIIRYQALGGRPWHKKPYTDFLTRLKHQ